MSSNYYMNDGEEEDDDIDFTQPHSTLLKEIAGSTPIKVLPSHPPTFGANKFNTIATSELIETPPINQNPLPKSNLDQTKPPSPAPTLINLNPSGNKPAQVLIPSLRPINPVDNSSQNLVKLVTPTLSIPKLPSEPTSKPTNLILANQSTPSSSQMKFPPNIPGMAQPRIIPPETQSLPESRPSLPTFPPSITTQFDSKFSPASNQKFPDILPSTLQGEPVIPPKFVPESSSFKPTHNVNRSGEFRLPASLIPSVNQSKQEYGSMSQSNLLPKLPSNPKTSQGPDKHPVALVNLNPSALTPVVPKRKEFEIISQQSLSISTKKKNLSLSSFDYQTEHLSSIDPTFLAPIAFNSSYDQLDSTDLHSLISQVLPYIDINSSAYDPQDFSALLSETSDFNSVISEYYGCICGNPGTKKLTCRHSLCENCMYSHTSCPKCYVPFSFYSMNSVHYKCLKCKLMKYKLHTCKHYCEDCVINELRTENTFECLLCPKVFKKEEALAKNATCNSCNSQGGYLIKGYHEVCIGHLLCFKCYKDATSQQKCYCGRKLETKELFRLKKRSRFVCSCCVKVRRISDLKVRSCCRSAACVKCQNNPECLFCKDKLE